MQAVALGQALFRQIDEAVVIFTQHAHVDVVVPGNESAMTHRAESRAESRKYVMSFSSQNRSSILRISSSTI